MIGNLTDESDYWISFFFFFKVDIKEVIPAHHHNL